MTINPYLIARMYALREAFAHPGYVPPIPVAPKIEEPAFNWDDLFKGDGSGDQGGGGGTAKGLRGKNDVAGKAAMRRLGRK